LSNSNYTYVGIRLQEHSQWGNSGAGGVILRNIAGQNVAGGILYGTWYIGDNEHPITSDRDKKKDIEDLDESYDLLFDSLTPRRFRMKNGTSGRYHTGFIAQEVEQAIEDAGLANTDFAALVYAPPGEDEDVHGYYLRYGEFVSLNTYAIKKLQARVAELESRVTELEGSAV